MSAALFGGIEAGGTKFNCAVGTSSGELIDQVSIPTAAPDKTIQQVVEFFQSTGHTLAAIGIGAFGPVQLDPRSPHFGYITSTPKTAWRNFNILGAIRRAFGVPVALDTDVNVAAIAEARWGAARGLKTFLYVTVGTGVGGSAIINGAILHGLAHPEMGHIRVPHDHTKDPFPGSCPYHGDCLEGLVSGPSVEARWGVSPVALAPDHPAWALEAEYLALASVNWICTLSPGKIVFGGGLMQPHLFPLLRQRVATLMNGYLDSPELSDGLENYIVPSALAGRAGVLGALALASGEVGPL